MTKTSAEATKRPWPQPEYDNYGNGSFYEWWEIEEVGKIPLEANALLIVKAVNCHDELVEALKSLCDILPLDFTHTPDCLKIYQKAQQALSNAQAR
jgi:hypothetical protein